MNHYIKIYSKNIKFWLVLKATNSSNDMWEADCDHRVSAPITTWPSNMFLYNFLDSFQFYLLVQISHSVSYVWEGFAIKGEKKNFLALTICSIMKHILNHFQIPLQYRSTDGWHHGGKQLLLKSLKVFLKGFLEIGVVKSRGLHATFNSEVKESELTSLRLLAKKQEMLQAQSVDW